jgi:hypothetical protein
MAPNATKTGLRLLTNMHAAASKEAAAEALEAKGAHLAPHVRARVALGGFSRLLSEFLPGVRAVLL